MEGNNKNLSQAVSSDHSCCKQEPLMNSKVICKSLRRARVFSKSHALSPRKCTGEWETATSQWRKTSDTSSHGAVKGSGTDKGILLPLLKLTEGHSTRKGKKPKPTQEVMDLQSSKVRMIKTKEEHLGPSRRWWGRRGSKKWWLKAMWDPELEPGPKQGCK